MGYVLEVLRNVISGSEIPLPDATANFGDKLVKGLLLAAITFIYGLPIMLISGCSGVGNSILANSVQDTETFSTIMAVFGGCFGFVAMLYGIAVGLLTPFIWSIFAETGQFGDAFKLNRIWAMFRSNIGQAIIVFLVCSPGGFCRRRRGLCAVHHRLGLHDPVRPAGGRFPVRLTLSPSQERYAIGQYSCPSMPHQAGPQGACPHRVGRCRSIPLRPKTYPVRSGCCGAQT